MTITRTTTRATQSATPKRARPYLEEHVPEVHNYLLPPRNHHALDVPEQLEALLPEPRIERFPEVQTDRVDDAPPAEEGLRGDRHIFGLLIINHHTMPFESSAKGWHSEQCVFKYSRGENDGSDTGCVRVPSIWPIYSTQKNIRKKERGRSCASIAANTK